MPEERLQKIIAGAGVTSRRKAEELILEGRVIVNGAVITELGSKADIERDHIKVDGRLLHAPKHHVYLALNKPRNYVTTVHDPERRATVMDLIKGVKERVYPVGRLDYASEGLLILTNDGELANVLTAAKSHVPKIYLVKVNGTLSSEQEEQFRTGVPLSGRRTAPAGLKLLAPRRESVVRGAAVRGTHQPDPQHVPAFWHAGGKIEARAHRAVGFGHPGSWRIPPSFAPRSAGVSTSGQVSATMQSGVLR